MNPEVFLFIYFFINLCAFSAYGIDKLKAIQNEWRISENTLLFLSLLGPIGALLSMILFRHKIRKSKFIILLPLFLLLHIFFGYLIMSLY